MINFDLGEHYKKDGMENASNFTNSLRKTVMPQVVKVLAYGIFKGVNRCLK